jgi:hypothetical protein
VLRPYDRARGTLGGEQHQDQEDGGHKKCRIAA